MNAVLPRNYETSRWARGTHTEALHFWEKWYPQRIEAKLHMSKKAKDTPLPPTPAHEKPHEWLMRIAQGLPVVQSYWRIEYDKKTHREISRELVTEEIYPDFETRIECAKSAAPYISPRATRDDTKINEDMPALIKDLGTKLPT